VSQAFLQRMPGGAWLVLAMLIQVGGLWLLDRLWLRAARDLARSSSGGPIRVLGRWRLIEIAGAPSTQPDKVRKVVALERKRPRRPAKTTVPAPPADEGAEAEPPEGLRDG
jgi:hypothetical protein